MSFAVPCKKHVLALQIYADILTRQFLGQLPAHVLQPAVAGPHREVEQQARSALLPDDQRGLSRRFSVDQHLARIHRHRFGQIAVGQRDALDIHGIVEHQRLAHGYHQRRILGLQFDGGERAGSANAPRATRRGGQTMNYAFA